MFIFSHYGRSDGRIDERGFVDTRTSSPRFEEENFVHKDKTNHYSGVRVYDVVIFTGHVVVSLVPPVFDGV